MSVTCYIRFDKNVSFCFSNENRENCFDVILRQCIKYIMYEMYITFNVKSIGHSSNRQEIFLVEFFLLYTTVNYTSYYVHALSIF